MSDYLDGPKFLAWLEEADCFEPVVHDMKYRASKWRHGAAVSVWKADELLTAIGLHISQIPDEIWRLEAPQGKQPKWRRDLSSSKEQVVAEHAAGASTKALSRKTGIPERTIREWTLRSKAKDALSQRFASGSDKPAKT